MLSLIDIARKIALNGAAAVAVFSSPAGGQPQPSGTPPPAYNPVPATPSAVPPLHGPVVQGAYPRGFPSPPPGRPGSGTGTPPVVIGHGTFSLDNERIPHYGGVVLKIKDGKWIQP